MKNQERDEQIAASAQEFRCLASEYLKEGTSPGVLASAMMTTIFELMRVQGMSKMETSNEFVRIIDGVREQVFEKNNKTID
ncbi:MAG: hypothetical protein KC572_14525 [Gammaproteobacteria bacterium]|nr:hypothetical protein [Gammaproteobacteria bacterium]